MRILILSIFLFYLLPEAYSQSSKRTINEVLQESKAHIDKKINEATVQEFPFPHIVIENIFPHHLYKKIHKYWPDSSEFCLSGNRGIIPATYGCLEDTNLSTDQKVFWRFFGEVIVNKYIKPLLIEKLSYYICLKYKLENFDPKHLNYFCDFSNFRQDCIVMDAPSYSIDPHIDQLNIFAALLFYLPSDQNHTDRGTTFLNGSPCQNPNAIYKGNQFSVATHIPFKPNTLVCFLQSPISWHCVEAGTDSHYWRKLYIAPIFFSPEFIESHYKGIYNRSVTDEYFFDHRFLNKSNWSNIWSQEDGYR